MALADWDFFLSSGSQAVIETVTPAPPVGNGWLRLAIPINGEAAAAPKAIYAQGVTQGKRRTLLYIAGASPSVGLYCMQSQRNMLQGGGGDAYALVFQIQSTVSKLFLTKITNGGVVGGTVLATAPDSLWTQGTVFAAELEWQLDLAELGGVRLTARLGTALDFSNLAPVAALTNRVDITSPLTATVTEGFYAQRSTGFGGDILLDQTELWDIS